MQTPVSETSESSTRVDPARDLWFAKLDNLERAWREFESGRLDPTTLPAEGDEGEKDSSDGPPALAD